MATSRWVVLEVIPHSDFTLSLSFADGKQGVFDMTPLLERPYYMPLANLPLFMTARAECGTVIWEDDRDIAPELLYENCHLPQSAAQVLK